MQWLEPRAARRMPIRLTPLIDVVFILLLFFMLSSRMEPMGLLQLETRAPEGSEASDEPPAELFIDADGLQWNQRDMNPEAVRERLEQYGGDTVILGTDSSVALSEFTRWLGAIESAGITPAWKRDSNPDDENQ